jgi:hypothetical protein
MSLAVATVRLLVPLHSHPQRLIDGPTTPTATIAQTDVKSAATAAVVEQVEEAKQVALDPKRLGRAAVVRQHPMRQMHPMLRCPMIQNLKSRPPAPRFGQRLALLGRSS